MLPAVQLHGDEPFLAEEIEDVRPTRVLAPKLETRESAVPQLVPERFLGVGHVPAEVAATAKRLAHATVSARRGPGCGPSP